MYVVHAYIRLQVKTESELVCFGLMAESISKNLREDLSSKSFHFVKGLMGGDVQSGFDVVLGAD